MIAEKTPSQGFDVPKAAGGTPFARIAVKRIPADQALPGTGQTILPPPSRPTPPQQTLSQPTPSQQTLSQPAPSQASRLSKAATTSQRLPAAAKTGRADLAPFGTTQPDLVAPSDSIRRPVTVGLVVFIGFIGLLGLWSTVARLDSAAVAPAIIKVQDSRRTLQHQTGGTIKELLVHEGEFVNKDQVLIRLDDGEIRARVSTYASQLDGLVAMRAQLLAAQSGGAEISFEFNRVRTEGFGPKDEERLAGLMQRQRDELFAKRASIANQIELYRQKQSLLARQIEGDRAQEVALATQLKLIQEELKSAQNLLSQGLMTATHVLELQRTEAGVMGSRAERASAVAQARESIRGAEIQIEQLKRDRATQVADDLLATNEKIEDLSPRLVNARAELIASEIKAPVAGSVINQSVFTVGGVIRPGERVLDVVPDGEPLVLEGKLAPEQVDGVQIGMRVEVRFPEFSSRDMPLLHGTVTGLSADRLTDPATNTGFFRIVAAIDQGELARTPHDHLIPGLPADIIVPLRARSAFEYLISPLRRSFNHAFRER